MDDAAFFASATEAVNRLERELRRVCPMQSSSWRALELGSGTGRLMRAMNSHFAELTGCEYGEARIEASRHFLRDLSNTFVQPAEGTRIPTIQDNSIDFAYSVGDFTERNGRAGALELFQELRRVLTPDGLACLRFTGQAPGAGNPLFTAYELLEIAAANDFQVLALEGSGARSLWTTWRKREEGWFQATEAEAAEPGGTTIRRITNASSNEAVAPCRGRFASILIYAENLPPNAGIGPLRVTIGTSLGIVTYIGPADRAGWQAIRVELPEQEETGLLPVQLTWLDRPIAAPVTLRVIPPGPMVPRIVSVTDALQPGSRRKIVSGRMKLVLEEIAHPDEVQAFLGGKPTWDAEYTCIDPQLRRYEWRFQLPDDTAAGTHTLEVHAAGRILARVPVELG